MHRSVRYTTLFLLFSGFIFIYCGVVEKLANRAPVITRLYALRTILSANDTTTVGVEAEDPDDDAMSFHWDASGGSFSSSQGETVVWTAPETAGRYTIEVTVRDKNEAETTDQVTVTVLGLERPVVEIQYPMNNEYLTGRGEITIKANASHANGISRVEFYVDDELLGTDNWRPYEQTWNLDGLSGKKIIKAVAYRVGSDDIRGEHSITIYVEGVSIVPL